MAGTATEIEQVLRALDGRLIPAGSLTVLRGLVNVLPTGRNFYSVEEASRLAWEAGVALVTRC